MKKIIYFVMMTMMSVQLSAQTTGKLNVSVTTSTAGGNFAPRNIVVIWIEDASGNFVKTLLAYADKRIQYLNNWEAKTNAKGIMYNRTDAITGATQSTHGTRSCVWDGTDYGKNIVADGKYFVCMELTDKNATGNYSKFEFQKGANNTVNPQNVPSFSSINISWEKSGAVAVNEVALEDNIQIFPNPGNSVFHVRGKNISEIDVLSLSGSLIFRNRSTSRIDMSNYRNGIYLARIKTDSGIIVKKIVKE